jgi:hypothetical protein
MENVKNGHYKRKDIRYIHLNMQLLKIILILAA